MRTTVAIPSDKKTVIRALLLAFVLSWLLTTPLLAGEASFTAKPAAKQADGKTTVTFAVSEPTDVEVAILDTHGAVVRHLAAGVLGGKEAPPAPVVRGLAQSLVDRKSTRLNSSHSAKSRMPSSA